jgi:hypothetical protein
VEDACLDGMEDLRDQPEEPEVSGAIPRGPVAVELRLLGLGEYVEPEPQVILVGQAVQEACFGRQCG